MNLVFKPTISPTLQACNQWQHLLQCCCARVQYTYEMMLRRTYTCSTNHLVSNIHAADADSVQLMHRKGTLQPKKGGSVETAESQNAMHLFSVNRETLQSTGKQ